MKNKQQLTGAQAVIATLRAQNVDTIFGIPGVHNLPLYDMMRQEPGLRHVLARHEQGVGFLAEGYARASGRPGVACTITGPGVTNIATPVASAYADSIPLFVISTSLPRASKGRGWGELHELKNQFGVMEAVAGWTRAIEHVAEIPGAIYDAFRTMRFGRPRGAYLQIPLDLLEESAEVEIPGPVAAEPERPAEDALAAAARLLREAQRPLIIAGYGVTAANANTQLARLAELLQAPVLLGAKSHDVLPGDHPLVISARGRMPGAGSLSTSLHALVEESDVALIVGSKLGAQRTGNTRLPLSAKVIQIDIDPAEVGRIYPATVEIAADARLALDALLALLGEQPADRPSPARTLAAIREALRSRTQRAYGEAAALLDSIRAGLPRNGIVVADMTMLGYASTQYFPVYEPRTYIHPSELCTIGCALPLALGAKVAAPEQPVVALCGDGGFLLNIGEMATAVQERIPVVTVIFNDSTYTAVKSDQQRRFQGRYIATDLRAPDYVTLAQGFGATGVQAKTPDELRDAIREAIKQAGPTLIEVPLPARQW